MGEEKNELIEKRRKRRFRKRLFLFAIILISILITLCLKLPYFNVENVQVYDNNVVTTDEIMKLANVKKGVNIFYTRTNQYEENLEEDPYILSASIHKKLPNTITISVKERKAVFYAEDDKKYLIIDKNGMVLEKRDSLDGMKLIKLYGFNTKNASIGKVVPLTDKKKLDAISKLTDIVIYSKNLNITSVDMSDSLELKAYINNMCIILGSSNNIAEKINKALNIILDENLSDKTGYVDVSFNGNPVYSVNK